jgi:16S rRNA (guanine527-N7)-methyltransferase
MNPARIAALLAPYLPAQAHEAQAHEAQAHDRRPTTGDLLHISTYIDLLLRWNSRINLTAIRDEEEIVTRHFGESLFAARHLFPRFSSVPSVSSVVKDVEVGFADHQPPTKPHTLADLGSGPGFPGIPIKLWAPHIHLTLIESNLKKSIFLREIVRSLTLTNVDIKIDRAESISATYDVVTLRAVERFRSTLPIAARLTAPSGRLALLISSAQLSPAQSALPQFTWHPPLPIPNSQSRILLIGTNRQSGK